MQFRTRNAHGVATSDWAITEAGFGFDLGAEKFFDIKCKSAGLDTAAVVLVATCRALKLHGGASSNELERPNPERVRQGLPNLDRHAENIRKFCEPPIVCLNRFADDTDEEIDVVRKHCETTLKIPFAVSDVFADGGAGGRELARVVRAHAEKKSDPYCPLYDWSEDVKTKIWKVAHNMYGAGDVKYVAKAERDLRAIEKHGYDKLPICIAKTPASFTDDPKILGRPGPFPITVREILISAGAGFLIPLTGEILRMPGLPRTPRAESIDLIDGNIEGVR